MNWKDALAELVTFIIDVAPEVWVIVRRQVFVTAIQSGVAMVICAIISRIAFKYTKVCAAKHRENRYELWDMAVTICWILSVGFGVTAIVLFTGMLGYLINPDYYAIRYLIQFVK